MNKFIAVASGILSGFAFLSFVAMLVAIIFTLLENTGWNPASNITVLLGLISEALKYGLAVYGGYKVYKYALTQLETKNLSPTTIFGTIGAFVGFVILILLITNIPSSETRRLNKLCHEFGSNYIEKSEYLTKDGQTKHSFFYSTRLDTCVMKSVNELENYNSLKDIQNNFVKDNNFIFSCNESDISNILIEKVEEYDGYVYSVPWTEYSDHGESLSSNYTKERAEYSRKECNSALEKKMTQIK